MSNAPYSARQEIHHQRRFVTGMTASPPAYKIVDGSGHKEWVVDVYLGPQIDNPLNIVKDVLVASIARQIVTKLRQPVLLERSKQGRYIVIGRSDTMPAGAQMPEGWVAPDAEVPARPRKK